MCAGDGWPVLVRRRDQHVPGSSDDVADGSEDYSEDLPAPDDDSDDSDDLDDLDDADDSDEGFDDDLDGDFDDDFEPDEPFAFVTAATACFAAAFASFIRSSASGVLSPARPAPL